MSLFRPAIAALSTPRQKWIKQSIHTLQLQVQIQQQHYQHPRTSAMLYKAVTRQKIIGRRLLSSGNMNSQNGKINNINEVVKPATKDASRISKFWKTFSGPKPMPERWTAKWYREMVLICTVFAITGSSTMLLVRPAVSKGFALEGSFKDGPWAFRICSLVVMTPIYATLLLVVGTIFGRHSYFRHFSIKMWSRFGIPPEMIDESYHLTKKTFRKW
mmetsp:Transcript_68556/g.76677  ORF Transcript_68556/g.76677 Transcript_68556/m.76677 type:complete len:216 (+) Transcript_68556:65-712(+)